MYAETTEQPRQLSLSPASPGLLVAEHILQDSLSPEAGEVVSPRPLLSPKQSFSVDPFTHTTFSKSERVEALERMAAETVQANANMSNSVPDISLDKDKTLPAPPVPSSKTKPVDIRPKINSLFPLSADEGVTPPTPTIAALSPKASRGFSGLDALEARLLFDVGTRKAKLEEKKHDGPSIQPITIPRPTDVQNLPIDSAISSLSLPGLGAEEGTLRLGEANSSPATSQRAGDFKAAHKPALERPSESSKTHEARVRKKSGPRSRHSAKEQEQFQRLRKAAEGRVAAWLGSIDPEIPPSTTTPPQDDHLPLKPEPNITASLEKEAIPETPLKVAEREHSSEARVGTSPGTRSSGFRLLKANNEASSTTSAHDVTAKPAKDAGADRNIKRKQLPAFLPLPADPEVHYDVRSARGGRGGKVTAVAALWASAAQKPSDLSPSPSARSTPRPQLAKPVVSKKINTNASPLTTSANTAEFKTLADRPSPLPQEAAQETNHRRPRTKATSLPAIMSSSLATPMLSSTASLAKPPPALGDRIRLQNKLPPTISESSAPPKVPPKTEMAFGQARLRELIKKYQG
ncbi:hypothetical protein EW026_g1056 [Hermanssonia centrifuga]|uniref:Uncharacterized protein n=1 Tax=Hermanssonia centrifuga TaxID=98765 RepID=A0A4S4KTB4_9APHY|nr:hypothetical protein EW026_g1056 [Hermanssonia centrifuga]